jgi:hypothetical protein
LKILKSLDVRDWESIDAAQADREHVDYRRQLQRLQPRLSQKAWRHFWHGFAETGIHDAHLISLSIGDGLKRLPRQFQYDPVTIKASASRGSLQFRSADQRGSRPYLIRSEASESSAQLILCWHGAPSCATLERGACSSTVRAADS